MMLRGRGAALPVLRRCARRHSTSALGEGEEAGGVGLWPAYARLLREGRIQPDASQLEAAQALHLAQRALPAAAAPGGGAAPADGGGAPPAVRGVYLWGPVGSGKTMLMDLFASTLPPPARCQRWHLHALLTHVHERGHALRQALPKVVVQSRLGLPVYRYALPEEDPLLVIASELAASCSLLAVDELAIADVADALTLGRLFEGVAARGTWLAFTSNRPVRDLYKGGINRRFFRDGFMRLCDEHLLQIKVAGGRDWRTAAGSQTASEASGGGGDGSSGGGGGAGGTCYVGPGADARLRELWRARVARGGAAEAEAALRVKFGREVWVQRALLARPTGGRLQQPQQQQQAGEQQQQVGQQQQQQQEQHEPLRQGPPPPQQERQQPRLEAAYFTFPQLCGPHGLRRGVDAGGPLSAVDALALSDSGLGEVFLEGVPALGPARRDEARRLVTLVDLFYDRGVTLHLSCEAPPGELFHPLLSAALARGVDPNLGRATPLPLERLRAAASEAASPQAEPAPRGLVDGGGGGGSGGGRGGGEAQAAGAARGRDWGAADAREERRVGSYAEPALVAEEVLAYTRAASRLGEMARAAGG
ncbi:hypothetical protein Rsub_11024 [Raphidocelis subcapitata]|uniref:AFG1-like ATPase n=1 Tax=Raphidocelis subcapitata TaxID=307507 RepID=A0A2V0PJ86_9CHLO|nr:hypothetical protein Rsub_11024 [Raphidocelis subcapitata]|eukprot:GBF97377.1 hypothetical protein Rsub_11024 [Raphidocelis subcapitata]